jgi:hypothetical protein
VLRRDTVQILQVASKRDDAPGTSQHYSTLASLDTQCMLRGNRKPFNLSSI